MRREDYIHPKTRPLVNQPLGVEEFLRRVANLTPAEVEENIALIRWFRRRYPTPRQRLEYARRMYEQATGAPQVWRSPHDDEPASPR